MKINPTHKYNAVTTVEKELFRSCNKYNWEGYSYIRMVWVIICELFELIKAVVRKDQLGPHGSYFEAAQVSACCQKMMIEIQRRS